MAARRIATKAGRPEGGGNGQRVSGARWLWPLTGLAALAAALLALWWVQQPHNGAGGGSPEATPANTPGAGYVGGAVCIDCHQEQANRWWGSHHDLAMQEATLDTVLGDFDDAQLAYNGVVTRFYRRDGRFMVRTDGADGALHDYKIRYTFGVEPLQQYLVALPGGRLQALGIAWDARPPQAGGQRWFHLYPDQQVSHHDPLHWTRLSQNWNSQCAACHSTGFEKGYQPQTRTFDSRWTDIDVACEACHGPGAGHVAWAAQAEKGADDAGRGLTVEFGEEAEWIRAPGEPTAVRGRPRNGHAEIEVCAPCHSRRSVIEDGCQAGQPFPDCYRPALLESGLYYPDGQIRDEVYVYGSFLQSRMYQAGVTCSDCHEPHGLKLRKPGDGVCLQCHDAGHFATTAHHHHAPGRPGAACVDCHMPTRTYMQVDARRDHSLRIPRPDRSVRLGTPNACNGCHADKPASWAAAQIERWYPAPKPGHQRFAEALAAAQGQAPEAAVLLADALRNARTPDIARATLLAEMAPYLRPDYLDVVTAGLWHGNALVRSATVRMLGEVAPGLRVQLVPPLLEDPVRLVRIEAARVLAGAVPDGATEIRARWEPALRAYIHAQQINAERPEAQLNLGVLYSRLGDPERAEAAYREALALEPAFVPACVNLADLFRALDDDAAGEQVLAQCRAEAPENAEIHYALGLLRVRQKRLQSAIEELRRAATLDTGVARYPYALAVALEAAGKRQAAIDVLEAAYERFPGNGDILSALASFHAASGNQERAQAYRDRLTALREARSAPAADPAGPGH